MSFHIGQRVVCMANRSGWQMLDSVTSTSGWWLWKRSETTNQWKNVIGPDRDETCVVTKVDADGHIALEGYPQYYFYNSMHFRPIDPLTEQMDRIESEGVEQPEPALV